MPRLFRVEVQNNQLRVLLNTARLNLDASQLTYLGGAIRDAAARVQARAVRNVSGYPVRYDGRTFRVVPRTGALKASIHMQWPYQGPLQARVYVNGAMTASATVVGGMRIQPQPVAAYAAAIEYGHGPIDLKQFMLGKTVPFFASRTSSSTGPYAARGLTPVGDRWENQELNNRLAAKGKAPMYFEQRRTHPAYANGKGGGSSYYIAFRKVGKKGWVIPAAAPRPFMRAALRQSEADTRRLVRERLIHLLSPDAHGH